MIHANGTRPSGPKTDCELDAPGRRAAYRYLGHLGYGRLSCAEAAGIKSMRLLGSITAAERPGASAGTSTHCGRVGADRHMRDSGWDLGTGRVRGCVEGGVPLRSIVRDEPSGTGFRQAISSAGGEGVGEYWGQGDTGWSCVTVRRRHISRRFCLLML